MRIESFISKLLYCSVLAIVITGIPSCKKANGDASASVQVVNASTDAGPINFYLSGNLKTPTPVSYGNTSGYFSAIAGNQTGEIKAGSNSTTVTSTTMNLNQEVHYSLFLCGLSKNGTLSSFVVQDDLSSLVPGKAKIRFVNSVVNSNVEFTIDNVESTVSNTTEVLFFKDIAYKAATNFREDITPGTHYITVSPYGAAYTSPGLNPQLATANLTFDSGKIYTIYFKGELGTTTGNSKMDLGVITNN